MGSKDLAGVQHHWGGGICNRDSGSKGRGPLRCFAPAWAGAGGGMAGVRTGPRGPAAAGPLSRLTERRVHPLAAALTATTDARRCPANECSSRY